MKQRMLISLIAMIAGLFFSQNVMAQDIDLNSGQVVWKGMLVADAAALRKGDNEGFIYLLQFKPTLSSDNPEKYISSGGAYGVQGVLSSVGMRMQIVKKSSAYQIITRVQNSGTASHNGDRMGVDGTGTGKAVYLDRGTAQANNNYPNWTITETKQNKSSIRYKGENTSHTESITVWRIQNYTNSGQYIGVNSEGRLVTVNQQNATYWVAVSEEDFSKAMAAVTWGEVDLGVFVQDAEFGRDNKDAQYWEWGTWNDTQWQKATNQDDSWTITGDNIHWHQRNQNTMCNGVLLSSGISGAKVGTNIASATTTYDTDNFQNSFGRYYKAEIYNEAIALSQELKGSNIPNLTDGLYKLTAQALYFDGDDGTTNNEISYFVVKRKELNDDGTVKNASIERLPVKPVNSEANNNITTVSGVSAGYVMNNNADKYLLEFFLEVNGKTNITIGIEQKEAKGWTVIGNVHLYAHGKQALFVDEDWCEETSVPFYESGVEKWSEGDPYQHTQFNEKYEYPATVYYNRTFTKDKFNPICLPIGLTGNQVRQAFGNDCQLSEFNGLTKDGRILLFKAVNLDNTGIVMEAGKPYIVKVTAEPLLEAGKQLTLEVGNGGQNHTVTLDGPIYTLSGVTKAAASGLPKLKPTTKDGITFEGTFYFTAITQDEVTSGTQDYWLLRKGDMYHLDGTNPGYIYEYQKNDNGKGGRNVKTDKRGYMIWGTYAYLHADKEEVNTSNITSLSIQGVSEDITAIENIFFETAEVFKPAVMKGIFTMNGMKLDDNISISQLPKGLYIIDGKKFVVK